MQKQDFRAGLYGTYKWLALNAGLLVVGSYYIFIIRHYGLSEGALWFLILMGMSVIIAPISRKYDYFSVENNRLIIHKFFWKTIFPIENIKVLGYRTNLINFGLTVRYLLNEKVHDKTYQISAYEMQTLYDINNTLKSINPDIKIDIDEKAEKYMKADRALIRKTPTTKIGWLLFVLKWFIVAAVVAILFLYFALRK